MDVIRKILIVDDAPMFRELASLFLARCGRVITASSAGEALELARRERPDVIVTDLDMPGMGGDELCRCVKRDEEIGETPVIVVAGRDDPREHALAVRAGADDVVAKPIHRMALIQAVNRFLRGQGARGLARVPIETQVHIAYERQECWGVARNLSRGGMFVEAEHPMPPATEVELEFRLPSSGLEMSPTAQVIWSRERQLGLPDGMGLQFLALDRASAEEIDSFVYERIPTEPESRAAPAGASR